MILPALGSASFAFEQSTHTDGMGNVFDAAGNHIGVEPGSAADVGSKSKLPQLPPLPSISSMSPPSTDPNDSLDSLPGSQIYKAAKNAVNAVKVWAALSLEDYAFMALGILLIGAALFSFKETRTVIETAAKAAGKAAAA
jgi:hypothetical protein